MNEIAGQIIAYSRGIWLHRWLALIVAWALCLVGWSVVYALPDRFEARARVFVDTDHMLKPLMSSMTVQPNVNQQIQIMSRTLISRPNVERVLRMTDLDLTAKTPEQKEALVNEMTKGIVILGAGGENLYTLTYSHNDAATAKKVVQSFLTIFVEGSLGNKRRDGESTRKFIDEQIEVYEKKLTDAENALKEFKRQNVGRMPEQGQGYYERLAQAQTALNEARLELREAENSRDALKKQLSGEDPVLLSSPAPIVAVATSELDTRIAALYRNLDQLRTTYTEVHPDIIATKRILEQLEAQRKEELAKRVSPAAAPGGQPQNLIYQHLSVALAAEEAKVAALQTRVAEYENRYKQLRAAVDAIPQVEAELVQLTRNYEVNKQNFDQLLQKRESARISTDMDVKTDVVDFTIIDPPVTPSQPSGPDRVLLMSAVLLGGLAGGIATAFLISQLRPTFNDRRSLTEATGLPLLGTISMIWTDKARRRRRWSITSFVLFFSSLISVYGALMAFLAIATRTA
ncbi:MAG: XrtA system polysaccharide chain length determinant [Burkholderiales bacterium]